MRIATLIIGLLLGLLLIVFWVIGWIAAAGADEPQSTVNTIGAAGFGLMLLWLVGSAFALGVPMISVSAFGLATVVGFATADAYGLFGIWGFCSLVLTIFAQLGWFGKRKERRRERIKEQVASERDARYEALLRGQQQPQQIIDVASSERPSAQSSSRCPPELRLALPVATRTHQGPSSVPSVDRGNRSPPTARPDAEQATRTWVGRGLDRAPPCPLA